MTLTMKPLLTLLLLLSVASVHAFEDSAVALLADQYRQSIQETRAPAPDQGELDRMLALGKAERHALDKAWEQAIAGYETLIATGNAIAPVWLRLAAAWRSLSATPHDRADDRALQAAYIAYLTADTPGQQALALFLLGDLYAQRNQPRQAIAVFGEGLAIDPNPDIAQRRQALVAATAFQVKGVNVESDSAQPRICLRFSHALSQRGVRYEDYLLIHPATEITVSARQRRLCISGVNHGQDYAITLRVGLPAVSGETLSQNQRFQARVEDRPPNLGFRGSGYILPREGAQGLPLTSVNLNSARLKVLRIVDRNLIQALQQGRLDRVLDGYAINYLENTAGELIWEGELAINTVNNQEVTTAIPLDDVLTNTQPGIYAVTAAPGGKAPPDHQDLATQWLVVSDLGLTTWHGEDGLHVFARSLASARPLANVTLRLYARNNSELGEAQTDRDGYAVAPPGLLRGEGGRAPALLMAYTETGDFNFIDLARAPLDLGDRGVDGREPPGPVDAFIYTERGVYRPGETVQAVALVRDRQGRALENLPLTVKLFRPDGVEARAWVLEDDRLGGQHLAVDIPDNARAGVWTLRGYTDPEADPVGQRRFQVEDFVPQQLELALESDARRLGTTGDVATVRFVGRFLYGAPAAGLKSEAELVLEADPNPYPDFPGFHFGLTQEDWIPKRQTLASPVTDDQGHGAVAVVLDQVPDTTRLLRALTRVSLFEPGGRPVTRSLALPLRSRPLAIGIRSNFGEELPIGQEATFQILALDPEGQPVAAPGLRLELLREQHRYYWYFADNRWNYRRIVEEGQTLSSRVLDLDDVGPTTFSQPGLDWGAYRLDVYDPTSGAATSVRFHVGWWAAPGDADTPDHLQLTLDRPAYRPGDKAQVYIKAPFAGPALLTVADHGLRHFRLLELPAEGLTVDLPVSDGWDPGVYVTATAFRPGSEPGRGPGRAVGLAWLALDRAPRSLDIAIAAPDETRPRQTLNLPITVTGLENETGFLTLAAVDEGILQLTEFRAPDPLDWFSGKRRLGVDLRDVYGRLIEASERLGRLRSGGDGASRQLNSSGVHTVRTVALFAGPLPLGADGQVQAPLELPDFNGQLRLMAVAWSRERLGRAEGTLLVRDPLLARVYLPRFLAPGDTASITLDLDNLSAPPGDYRVRLTASGAVNLGEPVDVVYSGQGRQSYPLLLAGVAVGVGDVRLTVDGPDGFTLSHAWEIGVRAPQAVISHRQAGRLAPGESLSLSGDRLRAFLPGTGQLRLSVASRPPLDVPGLLAQLDRYPYGCLEQTTSRALPLLYFNRVAADWIGEQATESQLRNRVQQAVERVLALQQAGGGFGLWNQHQLDPWLSAYALDFLTRAKELEYLVPDAPYRRGLDWLRDSLTDGEPTPRTLAARAYALYVLSRAGEAPLGELRYLHDTFLNTLPTPLARAQLGAALARQGDRPRTETAFSAALELTDRPKELEDYGTSLRDQAALLALLLEAGHSPERVPELAADLATGLSQRQYTSTQEQSWLLLAAHALLDEPAALGLIVNGQPLPPDRDPYRRRLGDADLQTALVLQNQGSRNAWTLLETSGVPKDSQPPARKGFTITRRFYTLDGRDVDPSQVVSNDRLVALITGEALDRAHHQALIVDLLPAGLEIENARLAHQRDASDLAWLPELSTTLHSEFRDDRFVAALDLETDQRRFALAYLLRAVTPGSFILPAVYVEDMYQPWVFGRGAVGRLKVD